ncbi:MAG: hypothetical protein A2Z37_15075 [Chloroflexi bacterium RBG_19FT_COMBO_62_14]|nr:MAG: hypothetical protein A2Z37_15075 [Chloroflexi bacterium RBG_19FT_COMBO_62_14]
MVQAKIDLVTLREFCQRNGIPRLLLFGSIARGDATSNSDIDLIADLPGDPSLLDMVRLERELSSLLGRKVDLLTQEAISPYIRERIQDDL